MHRLKSTGWRANDQVHANVFKVLLIGTNGVRDLPFFAHEVDR